MIDSGSSLNTFTTKDLKDILRTDVLFAQPLPHLEKFVDSNQQRLNFAEFINVKLTGGKTRD